MEWEATSLRPTGSKILVKREPLPEPVSEIEAAKWAAVKIGCKHCLGMGCFPRRVYEEDGLKVSRWIEEPCNKCGGRGNKSKGYDTEATGFQKSFRARVLAVGPGAFHVKRRLADGQVLKVTDKREQMPVAAGDLILVAGFAGWSGVSYFLDDDYMVILPKEILAKLEPESVGDSEAAA